MNKTAILSVIIVIVAAFFSGVYIQDLVEENESYRCAMPVELAGKELCYYVVEYSTPREDIGTIILESSSCDEITIGVGSKGILCAPMSGGAAPAVVAVGGWGQTAKSTQQVCKYFVNRGWICLALDSASYQRSEEETIDDIRAAIGTLKSNSHVDDNKLILWGGSNGARTTLLAAAGRDDIFAVASTSPPLFYDYDTRAFEKLGELRSNVIYIFAEQDVTDEKTAKKIVEIVKSNGKKGEYRIIPNAGHEICCGVTRILDMQYNFIKGLIDSA